MRAINTPASRTALLFASLVGTFILIDLVVDHVAGAALGPDLPHLMLAALVVPICYSLLKGSLEARDRAETVLRQARDGMEIRVHERTAELKHMNDTLQAEIVRRKQAEQECEQSLAQVEVARQRAEELTTELQLANGVLRAVIETMPAGVVVTDSDGGIILANPIANAVMGSALMGTTHNPREDPLYRLDGSQLPLEEIPLYRAIHRGESVASLEAWLHKEDDSRTFVLMAASPVRDPSGSIIGAVAMVQDITERKHLEIALPQAQAELSKRIQERTAMQERQRLSRELHDSVSQVLYGISLGAHTALTQLDSDRAQVIEALDYVVSLAQTGLMEMRALIFELRPESLETEGLVIGLGKQAAALRARYSIQVELDLCGEPGAPFEIKEALYRIAQEALQNAVKHARPDRLDVRLICGADILRLEICDNGIGFDPMAAYPGHLGLRSMRERATSVGGILEITSVPQCGTQIYASIPISTTKPAQDNHVIIGMTPGHEEKDHAASLPGSAQ